MTLSFCRECKSKLEGDENCRKVKNFLKKVV